MPAENPAGRNESKDAGEEVKGWSGWSSIRGIIPRGISVSQVSTG
jgi:hypothetical protein